MNSLIKESTEYKYTAEQIWTISNSSKRTWDNFVAEFLSAIDCTQKKDYLESHSSRNGGNK